MLLIFRQFLISLITILIASLSACVKQTNKHPIELIFSERAAIVEIGSNFIGIEAHGSSPLLNRISFFYPVANSIDLSQDYWTRQQWQILKIDVKTGNRPLKRLGLNPLETKLTPYSVWFTDEYEGCHLKIGYRFCHHQPAMLFTVEIENRSSAPVPLEIFTQLDLTIRTCHSYQIKNPTSLSIDTVISAIFAEFDDPETANAELFVGNVGLFPEGFFTDKNDLNGFRENESDDSAAPTQEKNLSRTVYSPSPSVAAFVYRPKLAPNQKTAVQQIIGSCRIGEARELLNDLTNNYQQEVESFESWIKQKSCRDTTIITGDAIIDHSVRWAKAIMQTNRHYLHDQFVPMPCPAQYNFFFTHDVLLSDLAAVYFDLDRVKQNLLYIINHARPDGTIPHAYYWKDGDYVTEYAAADNWNHFWFILLAARYLRHSGDRKTLIALKPFLLNSLKNALTSKGPDDLMWAHHPDWWDIGSSRGPRSYMTILAIRTIREFLYICSVLDQETENLIKYELLANRKQQQLNKRLWSDSLNYLINYYEDGSQDSHFYTGSILGCHFNTINDERKNKLVESVEQYLLDDNIGVYNVYPMDFHQRIEQLNFNGMEMGAPFYYANGGVWPHGNAWYALALKSIGSPDTALRFIKKTMTVLGIMNSPNGQPAMYEYRNSNHHAPSEYGKVDKPQFLWAAGWYLYSLYHLFLINENEWNVSFAPFLPENLDNLHFVMMINGTPATIYLTGHGKYLQSIRYNGQFFPSTVVPEILSAQKIELELGVPQTPYLAEASARLISADFIAEKNILQLELSAFAGHKNLTRIISPFKPRRVLIDGTSRSKVMSVNMVDQIFDISIQFNHSTKTHKLAIEF